MAKQPSPQWQPIERLALIATHIDGMLESATEQYETLQLAKPKPFVLEQLYGRACDRGVHYPAGRPVAF